jgi:hypothetical protein
LLRASFSGPDSRRVLFHRCASLRLHLHQVVKGTFTLKLSTCSGTPKNSRGFSASGSSFLNYSFISRLASTLPTYW